MAGENTGPGKPFERGQKLDSASLNYLRNNLQRRIIGGPGIGVSSIGSKLIVSAKRQPVIPMGGRTGQVWRLTKDLQLVWLYDGINDKSDVSVANGLSPEGDFEPYHPCTDLVVDDNRVYAAIGYNGRNTPGWLGNLTGFIYFLNPETGAFIGSVSDLPLNSYIPLRIAVSNDGHIMYPEGGINKNVRFCDPDGVYYKTETPGGISEYGFEEWTFGAAWNGSRFVTLGDTYFFTFDPAAAQGTYTANARILGGYVRPDSILYTGGRYYVVGFTDGGRSMARVYDSTFHSVWGYIMGDAVTGYPGRLGAINQGTDVCVVGTDSYWSGFRTSNYTKPLGVTGAASVWKLDVDGNFVWKFDTGGPAYGICTDDTYLYVCGGRNNQWQDADGEYAAVWKLDLDGNFVASFDIKEDKTNSIIGGELYGMSNFAYVIRCHGDGIFMGSMCVKGF